MKIFIVEDEPPARLRLMQVLRDESDVEIVGHAHTLRGAREALAAAMPDVVLLDIRLPDGSGLDLVRHEAPSAMPHVIVVTAHDEYALDAFAAAALDYVLKPVDPDRLRAALERARYQLTLERSARRSPDYEQLTRAATPVADRIALREEGRTYFARTADIVWVESKRNDCLVHFTDRTVVVRETLTTFETRLPRTTFLRVHRSALVNLEQLRFTEPWFRGEQRVVLSDGTRLTTSRVHGREFREFLVAAHAR